MIDLKYFFNINKKRDAKFLIKVSGVQYEVEVEEVTNGKAAPAVAAASAPAAPKAAASAPAAPAAPVAKGGASIDSPMPGNVLKINVKVGDTVAKGQTVFVLGL